jgi:hypothetical protein|tara:strand:- start:105 stop:248 length:144 start_codon:yes stop_codon:yes gene_type:complete
MTTAIHGEWTTGLTSMELFVGICIIPFLSALFIQAGQDENSEDHDFL